MPIYNGLSTLNKAEIIIDGQPMQKVYVGDKVVWQKHTGPIFTPVINGFLYNWFATKGTGASSLSSSDNWRIPAYMEVSALMTYLGGSSVAGGKLKETGTEHWLAPNTGATDQYGLHARGSGFRLGTDGSFTNMTTYGFIWIGDYNATVRYCYLWLQYNTVVANYSYFPNRPWYGQSVRLVSPAPGVPNGTLTTYSGNDGKLYSAIAINGLYWMQSNLAETRWRSGDWIKGYDNGVYAPSTNAEWIQTNVGAVCAYGNELNYV